MTTEQTSAPDPVLIHFKPGEYGALRALLEKGEADTALYMLNDIATRPELCLFTITHQHEYGVSTYITAGALAPDPYAVMGASWEGNHRGEGMTLGGPLNLRHVARSEEFAVPDELCPGCRRPMNSEEYTHPIEVEARAECPECQLCVECCPNRPDKGGNDAARTNHTA